MKQNPEAGIFTHRISVVIPTYYRPHDLTELLNSLSEQTVKPLEVIVVDDTPNATIKHVCDEFGEKFSKAGVGLSYIRNPKERSITIARNLGAKKAKGDILQFLDSDVVLYPDYLQKLQKTFTEYPEALGVGGWMVWRSHSFAGIRYYSIETLKKLFFLFHYSRDSCKHTELPVILTKEIDCRRLSGATMAFRTSVFDEFQFDESLKEYTFMEDVLLSGSIDKKYPGKLLMTPDAKCFHKASEEGRIGKSDLRHLKLRNRKYVLTRLFGVRGLLMFGWQNVGLLAFRIISRLRKTEYVLTEE